MFNPLLSTARRHHVRWHLIENIPVSVTNSSRLILFRELAVDHLHNQTTHKNCVDKVGLCVWVLLRKSGTYNYHCAVRFKFLCLSRYLRKSAVQMLDSTVTKGFSRRLASNTHFVVRPTKPTTWFTFKQK